MEPQAIGLPEAKSMVNSRSTQPIGSVFVGRQREMAELTSALNDALSGQGRLVMLVGEPGIGKTRPPPGASILRRESWRADILGPVLRRRGGAALLALGPLDTIGHPQGDANRDLEDSTISDRHASLQGL